MEIDITKLLDQEMSYYSASRMELGEDAGRITWENAMDKAEDDPLEINHDDARACLLDYGAWDEDELTAMSDQEINALTLQFIAGDIREAKAIAPDSNGGIDWEEYHKQSEAGQVSGNLFVGDDGRIYYYMGS